MLKALLLITFFVGGPSPSTIIAEGYSDGKPYTFIAKKLPIISPLTKKRVILQADAADSFVNLISNANRDGIFIQVNYGYRTHREQAIVKRRMLAKGKGNLAAKPGTSDHEKGLALDIKGCIVFVSDKKLNSKPKLKKDVVRWHKMGACSRQNKGFICKTALYWWLRKNAGRYGFYNDVPGEPWHWSYRTIK